MAGLRCCRAQPGHSGFARFDPRSFVSKTNLFASDANASTFSGLCLRSRDNAMPWTPSGIRRFIMMTGVWTTMRPFPAPERIALSIPYIDAAFVADQFNRYRKQQKVYLNRNLINHTNTFRPGVDARGGAHTRRKPPSEAGEQAAAANAAGGGGRRSATVSLGSRMRLDRNLVRTVMREVTSSDPDGDQQGATHSDEASVHACDSSDACFWVPTTK